MTIDRKREIMMSIFKNKKSIITLISALVMGTLLSGCSSDNIQLEELKEQLINITSTKSEEFDSSKELTYKELKTSLEKNNIPEYVMEGKVERVIDGDTVKVKFEDESNSVSVRLLLIDTPEDTKQKQYLGDVATAFAKEELDVGSTIYLETDGKPTDKYGRYLGYIWYKDNNEYKMYNKEVVSEGLARVGYIYDAVRHLYVLKEAQYEAKQKQENIWSVENYVTDRGFNESVLNR